MSFTSEAPSLAPPRGGARDVILETAKRLFAERGFDGVSISDIARETGASKANIFHHFDSKEGLYLAVVAAVVSRSPDHVMRLGGDGHVLEQFQQVAAAEIREAAEDELGVRLILKEIVSGNPLRSRVLAEEIFAGHFTRLVDVIRAQQAEGKFRDDVDPALAAAVLRSATAFFILSRDLLRHLPGVGFADDPERYAREATALILRGLLASAGDEEE